MGKSSKKKQQSGNNKLSRKELQKKLRGILSKANDTQHNPLDSLPPSFLTVPLLSPQLSSSCNGVVDDKDIKNDGTTTINNNKDDTSYTKDENNNNNVAATIQHYTSSQMPLPILNQCLELFKLNMSDMYTNSNWGLNMNEKKEELMHKDARFLVVLSNSKKLDDDDEPSPADVDADAPISKDEVESDTDGTNDKTSEAEVNSNNDQDSNNYKVLGFAHFRYELDDNDTPPQHTITYLYELQISPATQGLGLGKKLMTIIELLSIKYQMKKVMLTVFHVNKNAMGFYTTKNKYVVDECSPSNFEGNEDCDYEILSKCLGN